jgi:predicted tellurium resistance membrane protein TerC
LLVFGLGLAIILMVTLANAISVYIKKYKWIGWLGLLSILWVAADLIWDDIKLLL